MRICDWSADVCSSDLDASALPPDEPLRIRLEMNHAAALSALGDRKTARAALESLYDRRRKARGEREPTERKSVVSGKSVSVRVDLGGRRITQKTNIHRARQESYR